MPTTNEHEISLNGKLYPILGVVTRVKTDDFAQKFVTGDYEANSDPAISEWSIVNVDRGMGKDLYERPEDLRRVGACSVDLSDPLGIVLPNLATETAVYAGSATASIGYVELSNVVYTALRTTSGTATVQSYNNGANTWSSVRSLTAPPTDIKVGKIGTTGSITLCVATTTEVDYSTDGAAWAQNTTNIKFLAFWRDLLWGIDNTGILYFTADISGSWTEVARFPYPSGTVSKLLTATGPDGRSSALYIASRYGLHYYDAESETIVDTKLILPFHAGNGAAVFEWATTGLIYFGAGNMVLEYDVVSGAVRSLGLEIMATDLYVPDSSVVAITGTLTHLIVFRGYRFDGVTVNPLNSNSVAGDAQIDNLLRWHPVRGWDGGFGSPGVAKVEITQTVTGVSPDYCYPLVSNTYSAYRLWVPGMTEAIYYGLEPSAQTPSSNTGHTYATSDLVTLPTLRNDTSQDWVLHKIIVDSKHPTSGETIAISVTDQDSESLVAQFTKSATGITTYQMPSSANPIGVSFASATVQMTFTRSSTNTRTPRLRRLSLIYEKHPAHRWGWAFTVDLSQNYLGRTPAQMREHLHDVMTTNTLVEFVYLSTDTESPHYVRLKDWQSGEKTGVAESGKLKLTVMELQH